MNVEKSRMAKNFFLVSTLAFSAVLGTASAATTSTLGSSQADAPKPSTWEKIKKKTRSSLFTEVMSSAFDTQVTATPQADGSPVDPINAYNVFQVDYEVANNTRILYLQRFPANFNAIPGAEGRDITLFDPRFALRLLNRIPVDSVTSTFDFYVQPGITRGSADIERKGDVGSQSNIRYTWRALTVGHVLDVRYSFFKQNGSGNDWSGYSSPYVSVALNSKFSTQTWFSFPYRHVYGTAMNLRNFTWNTPFQPYVQNGIGYSATDRIWLGALVNNFILTKPTLKNTWASLWLSFTFL